MVIYGLSGKSGTGKSYHAAELCADYKIRGLIDDGLFIYDGNIVAGISAKKQATSMAAIKTALFSDDDHCFRVRQAIEETAPASILVIGTSDRMIGKICDRLQFPAPEKIIYIEDITTEEQRQKAQKYRLEDGMHVIPAPTLQVKKSFSGYFLDPHRSFSKDADIEKTVVRPTYSYLGDYFISDKVISDIVHHLADRIPGIAHVLWTAFDNDENGCVIRAVVQMKKSAMFRSTAENLQQAVYECVEQMTAFNIKGVEIEIRGFK